MDSFKVNIIIRPAVFGEGVELYTVEPGHLEKDLRGFETIEEAFNYIREKGKGYKLLYISDLEHRPSYTEKENLTAGPEDITWEPKLNREEVKEVFATLQNYHKYLSGGQDPVEPKNLDELLEYGLRFGGVVGLIGSVKEKLDKDLPLEFENMEPTPFKIRLSKELAQEYCAKYPNMLNQYYKTLQM